MHSIQKNQLDGDSTEKMAYLQVAMHAAADRAAAVGGPEVCSLYMYIKEGVSLRGSLRLPLDLLSDTTSRASVARAVCFVSLPQTTESAIR